MIKIGIVEDEREIFEQEKAFFELFETENEGVKFEIEYFRNASEFFSKYDFSFDAVFFDIDLDGENGMKAAKALRARDKKIIILFITNLAQYALKGYEVDTFDFLVKPVTYNVFRLKIKRLTDRIKARTNDDDELRLKVDNSFYRIKFNEIRYVEVSGHKIIYHTTNGDITAYGSMKKVESDLIRASFIKCNQCYLVNPAFIVSVEGYVLTVGTEKLQISRPKRKEVMNAMMKYMSN